MKGQLKVIISGGGTGGHIYPALSIADEIKRHYPNADILFVGAIGRMEMEKVPQKGYKIIGINISGIHRKNILKNILLPVKLVASYLSVRKIIKEFNPDVVVGVGGYASGPLLYMAQKMKIPTLIQEQNSFPGVTNKLLAKKSDKICVAYPNMDKFFPEDKVVLTGNPVRDFGGLNMIEKEIAAHYFGLDPNKKTILIIGGSLGAKSINQAIKNNLQNILELGQGIQILWQTGKYYFEAIYADEKIKSVNENVKVLSFIDRMDYAYRLADVIISRAGATSISELAIVGKPTILVPSPNVAEDHQTKNALALTNNGSAILIKDNEIDSKIVENLSSLLKDQNTADSLSNSIKKFALPDAAKEIYNQIISLSPLSAELKTIDNYSKYYFLGIGGIGMSALAKYFISSNKIVGGYDRTPSAITKHFEEDGLDVTYKDEVEEFNRFRKSTDLSDVLVIWTPAIPKDSRMLNYLLSSGVKLIKRSEALADLTKGKTCIAIAGTHGKTSTTTLVAHLLKECGVNFSAFLGGISVNYNTNFIVNKTTSEEGIIVVEADEFDRSFHRLHPDYGAITAVEPDHLDIYGTFDELKIAYNQFANQVEKVLFVQKDFDKVISTNHATYSNINNNSTAFAKNIEVVDGYYSFDYCFPDRGIEWKSIKALIPGRHNIENAVAAISMVSFMSEDENKIKSAFLNYKGVKRRFEVIYKSDDTLYVDDYAHHPTEIRVTLETLKELHHNKKLIAIFQPHLFSRTKDLAAEFGQSLSLADEVILLPIYPARELPMEGVSSQLILDNVSTLSKSIKSKEEIIDYLKNNQIEILCTLGAGDIDQMVQPILSLLKQNKNEKN